MTSFSQCIFLKTMLFLPKKVSNTWLDWCSIIFLQHSTEMFSDIIYNIMSINELTPSDKFSILRLNKFRNRLSIGQLTWASTTAQKATPISVDADTESMARTRRNGSLVAPAPFFIDAGRRRKRPAALSRADPDRRKPWISMAPNNERALDGVQFRWFRIN